MNTTKHIAISLIVFCIFLYLIGCFVETTFDISKWCRDARLTVGILAGVSLFLLSSIVPFFIYIKNLENEGNNI